MEPPRADRHRRLWSLIAQTPREDGDGWWRYAMKIDPRGERLWLTTTLAKSDAASAGRLAADYVTVLRGMERGG